MTGPAVAIARRDASVATADMRRRTFVVAVLVVVADQLSKQLALVSLGDGEWSLGALRLTVARNPGGPFGVATGASLAWTIVTAAVVVALAVTVASGRLTLRPAAAVGALIGGGVGNLLDRVLQAPGFARGAVVDWIAVSPYPKVFNLADVALRVSAVAVIVAMLAGRGSHQVDEPGFEPDDTRRIGEPVGRTSFPEATLARRCAGGAVVSGVPHT